MFWICNLIFDLFIYLKARIKFKKKNITSNNELGLIVLLLTSSHPVINPRLVLIICFLIVCIVFHCNIKSDSIVMTGWRFNSISEEVIILEPFVLSGGMLNHGIGKLVGLDKWTGWWWNVSHVNIHYIRVHVHVDVHCELSRIVGGLTVSMWLNVGVLWCCVNEPLWWHEVVSMQRCLLCLVWLWGWRFGLVGDIL